VVVSVVWERHHTKIRELCESDNWCQLRKLAKHVRLEIKESKHRIKYKDEGGSGMQNDVDSAPIGEIQALAEAGLLATAGVLARLALR